MVAIMFSLMNIVLSSINPKIDSTGLLINIFRGLFKNLGSFWESIHIPRSINLKNTIQL